MATSATSEMYSALPAAAASATSDAGPGGSLPPPPPPPLPGPPAGLPPAGLPPSGTPLPPPLVAKKTFADVWPWWSLWVTTWVVLLLLTTGILILGSVAVAQHGDAKKNADKHKTKQTEAEASVEAWRDERNQHEIGSEEWIRADQSMKEAEKEVLKHQEAHNTWSLAAKTSENQTAYGWGAIGLGIFGAVAVIVFAIFGLTKTSQRLAPAFREARTVAAETAARKLIAQEQERLAQKTTALQRRQRRAGLQ